MKKLIALIVLAILVLISNDTHAEIECFLIGKPEVKVIFPGFECKPGFKPVIKTYTGYAE